MSSSKEKSQEYKLDADSELRFEIENKNDKIDVEVKFFEIFPIFNFF